MVEIDAIDVKSAIIQTTMGAASAYQLTTFTGGGCKLTLFSLGLKGIRGRVNCQFLCHLICGCSL